MPIPAEIKKEGNIHTILDSIREDLLVLPDKITGCSDGNAAHMAISIPTLLSDLAWYELAASRRGVTYEILDTMSKCIDYDMSTLSKIRDCKNLLNIEHDIDRIMGNYAFLQGFFKDLKCNS